MTIRKIQVSRVGGQGGRGVHSTVDECRQLMQAVDAVGTVSDDQTFGCSSQLPKYFSALYTWNSQS